MPYLEPFLVKTGKERARHVTDPHLLEDIRGFCGQESQHYKCHRRLNGLFKANGYEELTEVEARMDKAWTRRMEHSLQSRLAYSAGFESMTNGMLVVLFALALPKLDLSEGMNRFCAQGRIYVAWTFTLFYWVGNTVEKPSIDHG